MKKNLFLASHLVTLSLISFSEFTFSATKKTAIPPRNIEEKQTQESTSDTTKSEAIGTTSASIKKEKVPATLSLLAALSLDQDRYSGATHSRSSLGVGAEYKMNEKLFSRALVSLRSGEKPHETNETLFSLGLGYEFTQGKSPIYGVFRIGYKRTKIEWKAADFRPAYESNSDTAFAGASIGARIKLGRRFNLLPELAYDYVPRSTYKKELGGNKLYNPEHHATALVVHGQFIF